jgi:hypothetical protein
MALLIRGMRGGAIGWGTALQAGRSWVRFPIIPSGRTSALGSTQPLTAVSTRCISPGG